MKQIKFPTYDNEAAHRQVKRLMMQHKQLDIAVEDKEVFISCQGVTDLRYQLNNNSWKWILGYLQTGDYEDFGVFPSAVSHTVDLGDKESKVRELVEQGGNVISIPFLRETRAFVWLRAKFNYGFLFFKIRRTKEFVDYLIDKEIW